MPLSFGIVAPAASPDVAVRAERLAELLDLTSKTFVTYKELAASVREGSTDVAWLGPVAYAWLAEAVTPIGAVRREGAKEYDAALVVREGSPLRTLDDLRKAKGLRAAWVDAWSAAGYVVPRLELARAGILPTDVFAKETFHGSHPRALEALAKDECDVAATYARAQRDGLALHTLATWGPIPGDVIAVRRNLGPRDYVAVRDAFRASSKTAEGRERMRALFGGEELDEDVGEGHVKLRLAYESGVASGLFD